ncbi:hypothetical protein [Helicobacter himalayensis]|nr:hypothetical protein [Helicobacter himalayensis]
MKFAFMLGIFLESIPYKYYPPRGSESPFASLALTFILGVF